MQVFIHSFTQDAFLHPLTVPSPLLGVEAALQLSARHRLRKQFFKVPHCSWHRISQASEIGPPARIVGKCSSPGCRQQGHRDNPLIQVQLYPLLCWSPGGGSKTCTSMGARTFNALPWTEQSGGSAMAGTRHQLPWDWNSWAVAATWCSIGQDEGSSALFLKNHNSSVKPAGSRLWLRL